MNTFPETNDAIDQLDRQVALDPSMPGLREREVFLRANLKRLLAEADAAEARAAAVVAQANAYLFGEAPAMPCVLHAMGSLLHDLGKLHDVPMGIMGQVLRRDHSNSPYRELMWLAQ